MNLKRTLSSKNFFVFNLVLIGIIFGFSLALLSFSCTSPGNIARAQVVAAPQLEIPEDALLMAEGLQSVFNAVAEKVLPSVVEVKTVSVQRRQQQNQPLPGIPWDFFFGPRGERNEGPPGQEREFRSTGLGSGIIIRLVNGVYYVVTNSHVVDGSTEIIIATRDGREYPAELRGNDRRRDLAILSFRSNYSFPLAVLGDSDAVRVGDWAIAIGNPLGVTFSVTRGIVSAVGRTGGPGGNINDFIQTDASINQGNSGGPLVNIRGEVIGINTWIASPGGAGNVGLGFAIPINNAKRPIDELIRAGAVSDGWLGVLLSDPNRETQQALDIPGARGSLIVQVSLNSPADNGGIRVGDFVTHFDGREVRGTNQLIQMVSNTTPGDVVVFTVIRDGQPVNFTIRIEARSDMLAAENSRLWPGLSVTPLTDELRSTLRLSADAEGLYVTQVLPDSPARTMGMQRGDRITAISDVPVSDLISFYRVLREVRDRTDGMLWFSYIRGDSNLESPRFRR